ncbi:potassium-transporting ATPase subunit KdpC [Rhodobacter capsulatus]|jgi:K+-transporting ATPase ATPase C chain|uniref:Potassium-transporting ATPase KdpC subunit n=1 Tax=Rhodobacter capsulatus (strain ATCC BAA-309 / NBRC 16581 / SB1003) TaxID=272942 RepID=D5AKZ4_RHOCB|nr:potassium-transporting ATPase subunit KdpC [Rhodobacter capsulatus]ADE85984.1 potassium-transporting ATPase, C subunit [Rhodobacter capsulatus SB 1003]ETD01082.1 ATPase [Rhodobacter capsulatus DE442]ETD75667.1 ATPase [Rhodobacter capsulatus R121]ETE53299.1 ATPase [Rhodobacter capsulatus Y262]MDS0927819.1 potassium-transporting ATPase subunit KdpC [Rhodobacter capsulatus]
MLSHLRPALVFVGGFTLLLGLAYPLSLTAIATTLLPHQAQGSLIRQGERILGSALLGQNFTAPGYFHPRPSATAAPYDAMASGGSNLGPLSQRLIDRIRADVTAAELAAPVPADAVTASASGLDPDISPQNAQAQVARVAAARGIPPARVAALVTDQTRQPLLGVFGAPRVNVLALNRALDTLAAQ